MSPTVQPLAEADPILQDGGECGALMRAMDWTSNPLGRPSEWPPELRVIVGIALGATQPMFIVWGPERTTLYNDAYAKICGSRHPAAMGQPFHEIWFDIWDQLDPIVADAYNGIGTAMDDIELIMHRNGYAEETHFAFSYSPVRDSSGTVLGMFCPCVETTAEVLMRRRLAKEREQMRRIFEMALGAVAIVEGPEHVFTFANSEYLALAGHRSLLGWRVADALPEVVEQGFVKLLDDVLATGKTYIGRNVETELQRAPGDTAEKRVLDFAYHAIIGADGRAEGIFVQAIDVTDRVDAERQQQVLNVELAHRLKNQLSLVQAIANQTFRFARDIGDARTALINRISVLARAQEMLLSATAESTTVGAILEDVASLHEGPAGGRFEFGGPDLETGPRGALSLSLMLHELSTNAAKYGALSVDTGKVVISWRIEPTAEGDQFVLDWQETGGPSVSSPTHTGSGTRLLKAGVSSARFCQVDLSYEPSGARCTIRVDIDGMRF
tara:strand:+ start:6189 stop:7682 length:1494 start_codon:yes stop_codon:yes gene_type:complete